MDLPAFQKRRIQGIGMAVCVFSALLSIPGTGKAVNEATSASGVVTVQEVSGAPGGKAVVKIMADGKVKNLAGVLLVLQFDPALKLSKDDVAAGPLFASAMKQANLKQKGRVTLGLVNSQNVQGPGELARLTFQLPSNATPGKTYPLRMTKIETNDENADAFATKSRDGAIQVTTPKAKGLKGKGKTPGKNPK